MILEADRSSPVLAIPFVLLVAVLFEPLRSRLQSVVDRTFYRERVSYRRFLADLARPLRTAVSLDDALVQLVERVSQTMHISAFIEDNYSSCSAYLPRSAYSPCLAWIARSRPGTTQARIFSGSPSTAGVFEPSGRSG